MGFYYDWNDDAGFALVRCGRPTELTKILPRHKDGKMTDQYWEHHERAYSPIQTISGRRIFVMKRLCFGRQPADTRYRYHPGMPFSEGLPRSNSTDLQHAVAQLLPDVEQGQYAHRRRIAAASSIMTATTAAC